MRPFAAEDATGGLVAKSTSAAGSSMSGIGDFTNLGESIWSSSYWFIATRRPWRLAFIG